MKKNVIYYIAGLMLLFASCETIEERDSLGPLLTASDIKIEVTSTTPGGNQIVVKNTTPNVAGTWNLLVDKSIRSQDTVLLPFLGDNTIEFFATTPGGVVKTSKTVKITTIDHPLLPEWAYFAGTTAVGKTWVWATDIPGGKCYGNGGYKGNVSPGWWTCGSSDLTGWGVLSDEMTFDLNGSANFKLVTGNTSSGDGLAAGTYKGSFKFDMSKTKTYDGGKTYAKGKLYFTGGTTVSRGFAPNAAGKPNIFEFDILKINADEMVLEWPEGGDGAGDWSTAWFWMFKRKGYTYPTK